MPLCKLYIKTEGATEKLLLPTIKLAKLAVISNMMWDACLVGKLACLFHLLYAQVKKQPYLLSTSSYKLSLKSILFIMCVG